MSNLLNIQQIQTLHRDVGSAVMQELLTLLIKDAQEHINIINAIDSVSLGQQPDAEVHQRLNFHAHTLKGMSQTLGIDGLAEVSHWIEKTYEEPVKNSIENAKKLGEFQYLLPTLFRRSYEAFEGWIAENASPDAP